MHKQTGLTARDPRRDAILASWVLRICTYVGIGLGPNRSRGCMHKIGGRWAANGVAPPFDPRTLYIRGIGVGTRSAMGMYAQNRVGHGPRMASFRRLALGICTYMGPTREPEGARAAQGRYSASCLTRQIPLSHAWHRLPGSDVRHFLASWPWGAPNCHCV